MATPSREQIIDSLWPEPHRGPLNGDFRVGGWSRDSSAPSLAAVLVPLVEREPGFNVLLTQRTDHLHHHPGQVSFPGGRVEAADSHVVETAIREAEEEIGLERRFVEVVGYLDPYQTVTGFLVTPVVAFVEPGFELELDTFEVASAFEVPLEFVLDPAHHQKQSREVRGKHRHYYVMQYQNHCIWGATAAMLVNFYDKLAATAQSA